MNPTSLVPEQRHVRRGGPRVSTACTPCKRRRSKCDGARPKCGSCSDVGHECGYNSVDLRKARHTASEFRALQNRISYLEEQLRRLAPFQPFSGLVGLSGLPDDQLLSDDSIWQPQLNSHSFIHGTSGSLDVSDSDFLLESSAQERLLSGVNSPLPFSSMFEIATVDEENRTPSQALSALSMSFARLQTDDSTGEIFYVGPTSNRHLMKRFQNVDNMMVAHRSFSTTGAGEFYDKEDAINVKESYLEDYLMDVYRKTVHSTIPVFSKDDFPHSARQLPFILRCVVLAVAAYYAPADSLTKFGILSEETTGFYLSRFTSVMGPEIERSCIVNIKAFILQSYLAMLQGHSQSASIFLGVACTMTKGLGLHLDASQAVIGDCVMSPDLERDRQTTFWACFFMDRRLAVLEGRAVMMASCDIPCQRPLMAFQQEPLRFGSHPLSLELLYACHIELAWLEDVALGKIYSFSTQIPLDEVTSDSHLKFMTWYMSLPSAVRDVSRGSSFHPMFLTFHMCFHAALVLLHRPSLTGSGEGAEMAKQQCHNSAAAITRLLQVYQDLYNDKRIDVMVVHAAFTAALVHMVLLLSPDGTTYRSSVRSLRLTVRALARMIPVSNYAKTVYGELQRLAAQWNISPANSPSFWPTESAFQPATCGSQVFTL